MTPGERIPLNLLDSALLRKRAGAVAIGAVLLGGALGGLFGLFGGAVVGLIAAAIVALPLVLLAVTEARRKVWLQDGVVSVRAIGTRRVDLRAAGRLELLVTDVRGARTVGLLVSGPRRTRPSTSPWPPTPASAAANWASWPCAAWPTSWPRRAKPTPWSTPNYWWPSSAPRPAATPPQTAPYTAWPASLPRAEWPNASAPTR